MMIVMLFFLFSALSYINVIAHQLSDACTTAVRRSHNSCCACAYQLLCDLLNYDFRRLKLYIPKT